MISVIMSVYNEKREWIDAAIVSILQQSYSEIEFIIIVDNPDIDSDIKIYLKEIGERDNRIILLWNKENMGLAKSLNRGIRIANGKYIARMDADDISFPNRLEKELLFLKQHKFDMVSANKINIDENGNTLSEDPSISRNPNQMLHFSNIIVHPLVLVKTSVLRDLGGYRPLANSEDYDLWLRMAERGYKIGILDEYLLSYRIRANSASIGRQLEQYYINKYILKLRKERKQKAIDSFSENAQKQYLGRKNITNCKRYFFSQANKYAEYALRSFQQNKFKCIKYLCLSFVYYPSLIVEKIMNYIISNSRN